MKADMEKRLETSVYMFNEAARLLRLVWKDLKLADDSALRRTAEAVADTVLDLEQSAKMIEEFVKKTQGDGR